MSNSTGTGARSSGLASTGSPTTVALGSLCPGAGRYAGGRTPPRRRPPRAAGFGLPDFEFPRPEPAPVTTIAWRIGHITFMFGHRAGNHFGGDVPEPHTMAWASTADDALAL